MESDVSKLAVFMLSNGNVCQMSDLMESVSRCDSPNNVEFFVVNYSGDKKDDSQFVALADEFAECIKSRCVYKKMSCKNFADAMNHVIDFAKDEKLENISFLSDTCIVGPDWLTFLVDEYRKSSADIVFGPVYRLFPIETKKYFSYAVESLQNSYKSIGDNINSPYNCIFRTKFFDCHQQFRFDIADELVGAEDTDLTLFQMKHVTVTEFVSNAIVIMKIKTSDVTFSKLLKRFYDLGYHENLFVKKFQIKSERFFAKAIVLIFKRILFFPFYIIGGINNTVMCIMEGSYSIGHIVSRIKTIFCK